MSEWMRIATQYRLEHLDALVTALERTRPRLQGHVEANAAGLEMHDYHRKALTAQVVVRREWAGGWGDLGFVARPDGTLDLVADDGHRNNYRGGFVTKAWLDDLAQQYDYAKLEKQAAATGRELVKTENPDGSWRVEAVKRQRSQALLGRAW